MMPAIDVAVPEPIDGLVGTILHSATSRRITEAIMGRFSLTCLVLAALTQSLVAEEAPNAAAVKKLVESFGEATIKGDYARVIDATYDGLVELLGGRKMAIEVTESIMKQFADKGFTLKSFKVGEPGNFLTEGDNTFVVVPTKAEMTMPGGKAIIKSYLLGISADAGKSWKFADGAGMDNKQILDRVLPKLPTKLKLPDKQQPEMIKN